MRRHKQLKAMLSDWMSIKVFLKAIVDLSKLVTTLTGWRSVDICVRVIDNVVPADLQRIMGAIDHTVVTFGFQLVNID